MKNINLHTELEIPTVVDFSTLKYIKNRKKPIVGIYKITSPSGSIYIGQAVDIRCRRLRYESLNCKGQDRIYNSLKKHTFNNHTFEIIHIIEIGELTKSEIIKELNKLEIYYIKEFNSFAGDNDEFGMNLTRGGEGTEKSPETIEKIRKSATGKKQSPETIKKRMGVNHGRWFLNKNHTKDAIKRMSESKKGKPAWNKGKPMSEEQIQKMRKPKSEEFKIKMKPLIEKLRLFNLGTKHSQERINKVKYTCRKKFMSYEESKEWVLINLIPLGINNSVRLEKNKHLLPSNVPRYPRNFYKNHGWINWKDWFSKINNNLLKVA